MVGLGDNTSLEELQWKVSNSFEGRFRSTKKVHVDSWGGLLFLAWIGGRQIHWSCLLPRTISVES